MRSALLTIFFIIFIDLLGFGIVIPILPYYAEKFGASAEVLGLLMMSYSLMQFIMAPFWGSLSDRYGRKPILLVSILGGAVSMMVMGFADSLLWLFVGRIFAGIFGANISTAYAYVSDVTTEENRAKGMGLIGAAFGLGFIFGPAFGGILAGSEGNYALPMFVGSGLAFLNFFQAVIVLKEPPLGEAQREANRSRKLNLDALRLVIKPSPVALTIWMFFLLTLAVTQLEVTFALYMLSHFGLRAKEAGLLLALSGFFMVLMQGGIVGRLSKKFGENKLVTAGSILAAVSLYFFAESTTLTSTAVFLCLLSIGHGALHPALSSLTSKYADPNRRGFVMGVFHSASSFARVIGPVIAGVMYDNVGQTSQFMFGAVLLLAVLGLNTIRLSSTKNIGV